MTSDVTNEDFFCVIGQIYVFFATWDFFSTMVIVRLIRPGVKLPNMTRATLGQKLRSLAGLSADEVIAAKVLEDIQAVLPEARRLSTERNRFIHDQWMFKPELVRVGQIQRLTIDEIGFPDASPSMRMSAKDLKLKDLYSFLHVLGEQQKSFGQFMDRLPGGATSPK